MEDSCAICLLKPRYPIKINGCRHGDFCRNCVGEWFLTEKENGNDPPRCPLCRTPFSFAKTFYSSKDYRFWSFFPWLPPRGNDTYLHCNAYAHHGWYLTGIPVRRVMPRDVACWTCSGHLDITTSKE